MPAEVVPGVTPSNTESSVVVISVPASVNVPVISKLPPTFKFFATPIPPVTVNAPSDELFDSSVFETLTTPLAAIEIASGSDTEPIFPVSGIIILVPNVASSFVINNSSVPFILRAISVAALTFIEPSASELIYSVASLN